MYLNRKQILLMMLFFRLLMCISYIKTDEEHDVSVLILTTCYLYGAHVVWFHIDSVQIFVCSHK